jgi:serine protease Do
MMVTGFGEIAEQLRRATVLIRSENHASGSGVIWSSEGSIVTNAHVVHGPRPTVELWDSREFAAKIVSRDSRSDLACLRIAASNLPAASIADSSRLRPGELAIAVGNPLGFVGALATGIIHAVGPLAESGSRTWVQAGVRLAPGNSGGPLADARGQVIGINTMMARGLALAIPSNAARDFLAGHRSDGWLGVTVRPIRVQRAWGDAGKFGLLLLEVEERSPAAFASLLPGDILLGIEGKPFATVHDLADSLEGKGPRVVRFEFSRGGSETIRRVSVRLGEWCSPGSGIAA